jgi:hypothetical protein
MPVAEVNDEELVADRVAMGVSDPSGKKQYL